MRFVCRQAVLLVLASVLVVEANAAPYRETATGLVFPDTIAGLDRFRTTEYEEELPGAGVGVGYRHANGIKADIYVYSGGFKSIPDGARSGVVLDNFREADRAISRAVEKSPNQKFEKLGEAIQPLGNNSAAPEAASGHYVYIVNGEQLFSHVYVTGWRNYFVKIRFSYPNREGGNGASTLEKFVAQTAKLLLESPPPPSIPTKDRVLRLIARFLTNPFGKDGREAAADLLDFTEKSDEVEVALEKEFLPLAEIEKTADQSVSAALLTSYVAGNVKSQIIHGKKEDDPLAATLQMLKMYEQLKTKTPSLRIPELEKLRSLHQGNKLSDYIRYTIQQRNKQQ